MKSYRKESGNLRDPSEMRMDFPFIPNSQLWLSSSDAVVAEASSAGRCHKLAHFSDSSLDAGEYVELDLLYNMLALLTLLIIHIWIQLMATGAANVTAWKHDADRSYQVFGQDPPQLSCVHPHRHLSKSARVNTCMEFCWPNSPQV